MAYHGARKRTITQAKHPVLLQHINIRGYLTIKLLYGPAEQILDPRLLPYFPFALFFLMVNAFRLLTMENFGSFSSSSLTWDFLFDDVVDNVSSLMRMKFGG